MYYNIMWNYFTGILISVIDFVSDYIDYCGIKLESVPGTNQY